MAQIDFTGNLGADAELRHGNDGSPVVNFRVADTKSKPDGNGGWQKSKEQWINVALWGEAAEFYGPKLVKGSRVRVFGEFYAREYEGNNGKGIALDVTAQGISIFPPRKNQQQGNGGGFNNGGGNATPPPNNGNWNAPAADPWGAPAGGNGGFGNPGQTEPPF